MSLVFKIDLCFPIRLLTSLNFTCWKLLLNHVSLVFFLIITMESFQVTLWRLLVPILSLLEAKMLNAASFSSAAQSVLPLAWRWDLWKKTQESEWGCFCGKGAEHFFGPVEYIWWLNLWNQPEPSEHLKQRSRSLQQRGAGLGWKLLFFTALVTCGQFGGKMQEVS